MKLNRVSCCRSEQASALVIVMISAALCATLALAIVVNRSQSMKQAVRRQQDELANLDSRIQAGNVKGIITQQVQNQTGGVDLSSPLASALGQVTGYGSLTTDEDGNSSTAYAVAPGSTPATTPLSILQYTPTTAKNGYFQPQPGTPLTNDETDPLWGLQVGHYDPANDMLLNIDVTPSGAKTVFYAGQTTANKYTFRQVPLSIYSLYANDATTLSSAMVYDPNSNSDPNNPHNL
ncbi:MAG: hypothetical protein JOY92_09265, partial [Verrucomicrobia bacterium]|nr:hypothetical protein [Verrucomicrobiota bacterium]